MAGIEGKYELPDPVEKDVFDMSGSELAALDIQSMPSSLAQAVEFAEASPIVRKALGDHIFDAFIKSKKIEWDRYRTQVHDYELKTYLPLL
jgi:glutamine synthetase